MWQKWTFFPFLLLLWCDLDRMIPGMANVGHLQSLFTKTIDYQYFTFSLAPAFGSVPNVKNLNVMKTPRLILDYSKWNDPGLNLKALSVTEALTGNTYFPNTTPSLADFTILQTAFSDALKKAANGDRLLIALKNQAKTNLLAGMRQLAMDIDALANGDKVMLASSGFELASPGDIGLTISNPVDFKISDGMNAGELKLSCKRVPHAISYIFEHTDEVPAETTAWKTQPSSTREFTIRGLKSGLRVYGRIKAVGRRGQEANSDILSRVVQ